MSESLNRARPELLLAAMDHASMVPRLATGTAICLRFVLALVIIEEAEFVILFGGPEVDGGGWWVDAQGHVHHIDPLGPFAAGAGTAVGQLLRASQALPEGGAREQVARAAQETVDVLVRELGLGSGTKTLMFIDDGAPWCGTGLGGKLHPQPLPVVKGPHPVG